MREKTENGFCPGHYKAKVARLVLTRVISEKINNKKMWCQRTFKAQAKIHRMHQ